MPAIAIQGGLSAGHDCFPPTQDIGPYTTKSFFNGKPICLQGKTMYQPHSCGRTTHPSEARKISVSGGTFFLEGSHVALIGDNIDCGDAVGRGSSSAFIG